MKHFRRQALSHARSDQGHDQIMEQDLPLIGRLQQRPLVGREHELSILQQQLMLIEQNGDSANEQLYDQGRVPGPTEPLDESATNSIQGLVLYGEAGIGKTRLAEETAREALARGWNIIWNRIYTQESHIPYRLWIEVVRNIWQQGLWPDISAHPERARTYQPLVTLLPELAEHLPAVPATKTLSREQELLHLWEAILTLLLDSCAARPILIVLDDLQWIDLSSAELLDYLLRRLRGARVLLVITFRDSDLPEDHRLRALLAGLQREHAITALQLAALTQEEIRALVCDMPELMAQHIQHQSAGNPLFAEELARVFWLDGGHGSTDNPTIHYQRALPQTITTVLNQRLQRLSPACQQLLSHAAVLGDMLSFTTLRLLESTATKACDERQLQRLIEEAVQAAILMEQHEGEQTHYHFWHPLLMSHLYESFSAARRARLHQRAAGVLRQVYADRAGEIAALLTYHLIQAGAESHEICVAARQAADRAYALCAFPDAERHYRIVLEQSGRPDLRTTALSETELNEALSLYERLGECTRNQGKFEVARSFYEQALKLHQQYYTPQHLLEDAGAAQFQALLWSEIGVTWYNRGNVEQARHCYAYGEEVLRQAEMTEGAAWAYLLFQQSFVQYREGDYPCAQLRAHEALQLFQAVVAERSAQETVETVALTRTRRILAGDPINLGRTYALLGMLANCIGCASEALQHLNAALTIYEQNDYQREIAIVCCNLGDFYLRRAEHQQAEAFFKRSLQIAERMGEIPSTAVALGNLGVLALHAGALAEAERWLRRGLVLSEQVDEPIYACLIRTYLALVLQEQGRLQEARVLLQLALSLARAAHIAPSTSLVLVMLGNMRVKQVLAANLEALMLLTVVAESGETRLCDLPTARKYLYTVEIGERMLKQAHKTLQHALVIEWMEAETRLEGELIQAHVLLLLGEIEPAQLLVVQTLTRIQQCELLWLQARALRLAGWLYAMQGQHEQSEDSFAQALEAAQRYGMLLEEARIWQWYGSILLQEQGQIQEQQERGRTYLRKALQLFTNCHAELDAQMVRQILLSCPLPLETETCA